jgi:uncharacterized protein YndB with AHSA1/START domain
MFDQSFTTTFVVHAEPAAVFAAINDVRGWWGEGADGPNDAVGDEFTYRVEDVHYSRIEVTRLVPGESIAWRVLDNHLSFVEDQSEWVGTTITFEIVPKGARTEVRFAHLGLVPSYECFDVCSNAWGSLMHGSLKSLITTGRGQPFPAAARDGA